MIATATLLAFVPAALLMNLTPGADMTFCLGQGLSRGRKAAVLASAGVALGCMVHVTVAGLGLGALVAAHDSAFDAIRWAGVAYLVWLAWRMLRAPPASVPIRRTGHGVEPAAGARAFLQGLATNLLNPKIVLFVLAFLPQFIAADRPILPQFLVMGAILALGGLVINAAVGLAAGTLATTLARSGPAQRWLSRATAAIFLGLAARLALMQR